FAKKFTERIGKLAGNMPGDHRKNTIGLTARMSKAAGLAGCGEADPEVEEPRYRIYYVD
ncbi:hypothetical protein B296_00048317, partial [Ensete ventricosum]